MMVLLYLPLPFEETSLKKCFEGYYTTKMTPPKMR